MQEYGHLKHHAKLCVFELLLINQSDEKQNLRCGIRRITITNCIEKVINEQVLERYLHNGTKMSSKDNTQDNIYQERPFIKKACINAGLFGDK